MHNRDYNAEQRRMRRRLVFSAMALFALAGLAFAHPLGNFTINHFARIEVASHRISVRYVIDMAEIPAFQELQVIRSNGDESPSKADLKTYADRVAASLAAGILLDVDGSLLPLNVTASNATLPPGAGGLATLRVECDFESPLDSSVGATRRMRYEDTNYRDRMGWREIVVTQAEGQSVFDSSAFGNGLTDELKAYPEDSLAAPLDERIAELSFVRGPAPAGTTGLVTRDGRKASQSRDRLAELITAPELTPLVAILGVLLAAVLGAFHSLSPGHGKTVVGAYLVGSRGTPRHAAFLGLTVTITHTAGVLTLGLVTLFASHYVVTERLFPILSLISGGIVVTIGLNLFVRRLRAAMAHSDHGHDHTHNADGDHHDHSHSHAHQTHNHSDDGSATHTHDGKTHSHLPPGSDGSRVSWRSLLALGISGGLLPCPSALVLMLSAISLHRVGYGLILVIAFSIGLASALTAVGLIFVYARHLVKRPLGASRLVRALPVLSAFVITCAGLVICYQAMMSAGWISAAPVVGLLATFTSSVSQGSAASGASVLALGLVFGLKHAVEADHLAAVSTIVSQRKGLLSSSVVGGLWGLGHTISLLIAGVAVLLLHVKIGARTAMALELCVALMLIALGANALRKLLRGGEIHAHSHVHGGHAHFHPHIDDEPAEAIPATHHGLRLNARPVLVGMVHGLAGSAALMLLVLSTIPSAAMGFMFIAVFGAGSIGGMTVMSALVSLPLQFTADRFKRINWGVQVLAAVFSLGLGALMAYQIGFLDGLFG